MDKTKMILVGTGGAIGLGVLVIGFFTWMAFSDKTKALEGDEEGMTDGLETVVSKAQSLTRAKVYPCAASVAALESNRNVLVEWRAEAIRLATRGDRIYEATTPPSFKAFIVADAKRLSELPGGVAGKFTKPDFAFGPFKDYVVEGKMPDPAKLPDLQRQWDDVATVVEILSQNGVRELTDIQFVQPKEEPKNEAPRSNRGKTSQASRTPQTSQTSQTSHTYVFAFDAKPTAFGKVVNALVTSERFVTVDSFTFARAMDGISEALGGEEKKESAARPGRRARRARAAVETPTAEKDAAAKKGSVIVDPAADDPISVRMTVTVTDFGSLAEEKKEEQK